MCWCLIKQEAHLWFQASSSLDLLAMELSVSYILWYEKKVLQLFIVEKIVSILIMLTM